MTVDDLDEDGAERPRLPRAVMDRSSRPGSEPTTLETVGDQWHYAFVVQAGDDDGCRSDFPTLHRVTEFRWEESLNSGGQFLARNA